MKKLSPKAGSNEIDSICFIFQTALVCRHQRFVEVRTNGSYSSFAESTSVNSRATMTLATPITKIVSS